MTTCTGDEDWPEHAEIALRVDAARRPIEMRFVDEHGSHLRLEHDFLRVKLESIVSHVALRVTTRSSRLRWDPIVCIDARGALEGIVAPNRVLSALADRCVVLDRATETSSAPPPASAHPHSGVVRLAATETVRATAATGRRPPSSDRDRDRDH